LTACAVEAILKAAQRDQLNGDPMTGLLCALALAAATPAAADIGHGITLHFIEEGTGAAVVFVHGSLSDYSYWSEQVHEFGRTYHALAYSRRYNFPNQNPARARYSAITDADDLAAFIKVQHLGPVFVVGHSYGALTGLFLAVRHPELMRALVLAEPPAVALLARLSTPDAETGRELFADIQTHMVAPMRSAFVRGETETGVGIFIDYVLGNPHAWQDLPASSRAETLRDAREWEVMLPHGTLFPEITPAEVQHVQLPVLIMTGDKTYGFLKLIDSDLATLLPHNEARRYAASGHQMWQQEPARCRDDVLEFLRRHAGSSQ
jgi:non-heme chloroperoxidase